MNIKEFVYYYKAVIVSVLASLTDMFIMFELSKANWKEELALGLSSFAGIIIQFFGQKYWTFKSETKSYKALIRQVLLFFGIELVLLGLVILIFKEIYPSVEYNIEKLDITYKDGVITKYLVEEKDKKLRLNNQGKIVVKNVIVFFVFNLLSYPLWRYVIFK
jgi:putative flippase GtrA